MGNKVYSSPSFFRRVSEARRVLTHMINAQSSTAQHSITPRLLYDRKTAAQMLSISVRALDYLIVKGNIHTRRIGSRVLVPYEELMKAASRDQSIAA